MNWITNGKIRKFFKNFQFYSRHFGFYRNSEAVFKCKQIQVDRVNFAINEFKISFVRARSIDIKYLMKMATELEAQNVVNRNRKF